MRCTNKSAILGLDIVMAHAGGEKKTQNRECTNVK
jgi:hypothetical protein